MMMLITVDRVAYVGLLGRPRTREFGALAVYVSLGAPFQIKLEDGEWESAEMYVVAPETPHRIMTSDRLIGVMLIEAETVDIDQLPSWLQPTHHADQCAPALDAVRHAFTSIRYKQADLAKVKENVDLFFFGQTLERRRLDPRMAAVVDKINHEPCGLLGAEECARYVDLSFSRFLHLFKEDVGTTFRSFRAWKRARSFLHYVNTPTSLTDIALDIGYPDSSHFSHTVRRYWGLTPKDIIAGSRRLAVIKHMNELSTAA
ncbi:MAG TPA: AraC family transcriptional regulator [Noviherbaspirillum sp.]|uniref:helix-turn-helix transcriptional regulator n=1 Tax=Noviherbaspirillum sp. TaxID=1926288 RepID=UPI002B48A2EA|nr:AraC family transcriptional regulator [Noviherbaspirillum sp.]HJV88180.1 AraC family transcriptional regulator [Noviherbaspirillum sp.]